MSTKVKVTKSKAVTKSEDDKSLVDIKSQAELKSRSSSKNKTSKTSVADVTEKPKEVVVEEVKKEKKSRKELVQEDDVSDVEDTETVPSHTQKINVTEDETTQDKPKKKAGSRKETIEAKPNKKGQKQQIQQQVCDFINNLPQLKKQLESYVDLFKDICAKTKNKTFSSIKCEKIANKKQCFSPLHPAIAKYASHYDLNPDESYDSFNVVGKIKKYICNPNNKHYINVDDEVDPNKVPLILNSKVDIEGCPVLKGTFGKLIELMKQSDYAVYKNAAIRCRLSNVQTFCSILQNPTKKTNSKGVEIKLTQAQKTKEEAKQKILDALNEL